jgi:hypothetical protein
MVAVLEKAGVLWSRSGPSGVHAVANVGGSAGA